VPDFVREGRFANWLRDARDWAVSRNRFWGTPIPIWTSDDMEEVICIGSIEELAQLSGVHVSDLHKESVDPITIPSRTGRGVLRRVPEVFDCWFESGSMPYAQIHYPFENTKTFEEGFPADFIAEGIDQTRGWFYTLLVISTALFNKPPFKHLIVNGIVLASDGQKMSKRAKNYPDPMEVIARHGADALRLYLINSPVVRAQNLRFTESGVHEVVKDVFLPWYNALRFLFESSIIPFERATGQPFKVPPDSVPETSNFMDKWILSFTQSLICFVHQELAEYRLYTVVPRLVKFIDHLVNWYVRMNRRRLKGDAVQNDADWRAALHTLIKVIYQMTLLMSPFTPFITEFLYQRLRSRIDFTANLTAPSGLPVGYSRVTGAPDSVHYLLSPKANDELIDSVIEDTVAWMQATVELGRIIRTRTNLPLKAPLREAIVIHPDPAVRQTILSAQAYIVEELNVRILTATDDKHRYGVQLRGQLNHRTVGIRLKKDYKAVVEAVKSMSTSDLELFAKTGSISVCGHVLSGDDMTVVYTTGGNQDEKPATEAAHVKTKKGNNKDGKENKAVSSNAREGIQRYEAASDSHGLLVILDTTADEELEHERLARELINRIQRTRKKAELIPEDPIVIVVATDSPELQLIASPTSHLADLIQATVKQPLSVLSHRVTGSGDEQTSEIVTHLAESVLPKGWCLDNEIIRETVSIPPDDFELVLFARRDESSPISCSRLLNMTQQFTENVGGSTALYPKVTVRCAFGWASSANLVLFHEDGVNRNPLGHLSFSAIQSLNGNVLYAAPLSSHSP
ncbi:Isoleucine--tRNA ligase cytoplasmic, partial [Fasciolopsis buskii]